MNVARTFNGLHSVSSMQNCVISCRNTILNLSTHRIRSLRLSRELCEVILKRYDLGS